MVNKVNSQESTEQKQTNGEQLPSSNSVQPEVGRPEAQNQESNDTYRLKQGAITIGSALLGLLAFLFILFIATSNPYTRDLTKEKRFSLSEFTIKTVQSIKEPVQFTIFLSDSDSENRQRYDEVFKNFREIKGNKFTFKYVDPRKQPVLAKTLGYNKVMGDISIKCGKKTERIYDVTEDGIVSALISITSTKSSQIHFLTGHGERAAEQANESISKLRKALLDEGYKVENLSLSDKDSIPDAVSNLVIVAPKLALTDREKKMLTQWLDKGGNLFLALDFDSPTDYDWLCAKYGLAIPSEIACSPRTVEYGVAADVSYNQQSPITKGMAGIPCIFKNARPVYKANQDDKNAKVDPALEQLELVSTQGLSVIFNIKDFMNALKNQTPLETRPINRPIPLVQTVERTIPKTKEELKADTEKAKEGVDADKLGKDKKARAIFVGDADFMSNEFFDTAQSVNKDLTMNLFSWLGNSGSEMAMRSKNTNSQPLIISSREFWLTAILLCLCLPGSLFFYGVSVAVGRKRS